MKVVRVFAFLLFYPVLLAAASLRGIVSGVDGKPIGAATVAVEGYRAAVTDNNGRFALDVPAGKYTLIVTRSGFQAIAMTASADADLAITLRPGLAENIVVSGIRAKASTPVTKSDIGRGTIERDYYGQDIPLLLRDTPSISAYAEAGVGGSGYSYISLRGISPTRLNFTLDGVPLADSEDMGTYFADFPDLARSLQSIQVQRGAGTSTVGSPSFGGSINFESIALAPVSSTSAEVGVGSFGAKNATVGFQSGALPGGYAVYARLSADQSDGFRESSGFRGRNLFVSASKQNEDSQLRLTGFTAHEWTQQSFYAADGETLATNLRANPLSPQDRDSFGYDLAQLQYLRAISPQANMTASVFYQRGYGWYRLFGDQYGLDGLLIGSMLTLSTTRGPWTANYGLHVNEFRREHTLDSAESRSYANYGTKGEANAFAKLRYDDGRWHLYSDAQVRTTNFHYHGDVAIDPIRWTFFNPKIGARYDLSSTSGIYASAGISTREPTRNDLFQGEDNASFAHDLRAVKPERVVDLEAGWDVHRGPLTVSANLYAMQFRHEIASTGELSDIGLLLRRNVDRSYRRGLEAEYVWQATPKFRLRGNGSVSRNRIHSWTQFYDLFDTAGNIPSGPPVVYHDVSPLLTPTIIINHSIDYATSARLNIGLTGRHVGRSYLDNTNNGSFVAPAFTTVDANAAIRLSHETSLRIQVNNVFNDKRVFPSGYSYLFLTPEKAISGVSYYYPQATRNAVITVEWRR